MLGKQPIFTIHAELETITNLGRTPYGERRVIGILGGSVSGPKLKVASFRAAPIGRSSEATGPPISRRAITSRPMLGPLLWSSARACDTGRPR
jgi:Protein of unknown function (DUF3237)